MIDVDRTTLFEAERPRLTTIAARVLNDHAEAEDVVQQAWLRFDRYDDEPDNLAAWLTTVTTRLCLDRLRSRTPVPMADVAIADLSPAAFTPDVADEIALADTVGVALQAVLDRLTPHERVAFVLHDSFGFEFATIAAVLDTTPAAARKLASRARAKVRLPEPERRPPDWQIVDAFLAAARGADFEGLLKLLAPDAGVSADAGALRAGTPERIDGRHAVATFFDGSARGALGVYVGNRPGAAWFHQGEAKVVFDFTVLDGVVEHIRFRADPDVLADVVRRDRGDRRSTPNTTRRGDER